MGEVRLQDWGSFEEIIRALFDQVNETRVTARSWVSEPLFRGQQLASWQLTTTLERFVRGEVPVEGYYKTIRAVKPAIESFTDKTWNVPRKFEMGHTAISLPPSVEFMAYLRHYGFPSPLLDWTLSPYVAAFFAFRSQAQEDKDVAIYSFMEDIGRGKSVNDPGPRITGIGRYLTTQKRHHTQQCEYTICTKRIGSGDDAHYVYANHEEVFDRHRDDQDLLMKYVLPRSERAKVLEKLSLMNINAYSLFGSEESLMDTLAYREIERKLLRTSK